jgi:PilZ domain
MSQNDEFPSRRYPRVKPPAGTVIAWQSGLQRAISYLDSLALGGFFIRTKEPPPIRSLVKVLFESPVGEVRARAIVRRVMPGRGMAVEIIAMGPEDRARLAQFLNPLLTSKA